MATSLAPFVPSRHEIVKRMLELAHIGPDDVVFDLGCGDGRILISAVRDFGAKKAVGYEIQSRLFEKTNAEIKNMKLDDKISLFNEDLLNADIAEATVITLYLTTSGNDRLRPKLSVEARKGTRIVSHDFSIPGWHPTIREEHDSHVIYIYDVENATDKSERRFLSNIFRRIH